MPVPKGTVLPRRPCPTCGAMAVWTTAASHPSTPRPHRCRHGHYCYNHAEMSCSICRSQRERIDTRGV